MASPHSIRTQGLGWHYHMAKGCGDRAVPSPRRGQRGPVRRESGVVGEDGSVTQRGDVGTGVASPLSIRVWGQGWHQHVAWGHGDRNGITRWHGDTRTGVAPTNSTGTQRQEWHCPVV